MALVAWGLSPRAAFAIDDPWLNYWTLESEHFRVTYPHNLERQAHRVLALSESIYERLTPSMQYAPDSKTEVLLTDDTDSANGSATPVPYDAIRLFVTAPDDISNLGDYDDWLLALITHEYTHILHTGNISGGAAIVNRVIGRTLSPNSAQPRWVIEGLAVVYESQFTSGGRIRSSLFDTFLRADVLEDNFARLDQISSGADRWPYGNIHYLYGSRFISWLTEVYGLDIYSAISADYGAASIPLAINRAIRRVTGVTYEELYDAWRTHLEAHFNKMVEEVDARGRREGTRLTFLGGEAGYPRFIPNVAKADKGAQELVYYRDDLNSPRGLHRLTLPAASGERELEDELFIRTNGDSVASFTREGDVLFADTAVWRNLYNRRDLFSLPVGESSELGFDFARKRLTEGLRASYVDVSPSGREVVFTVNSRGTGTLTIAERSAEGQLGTPRALMRADEYDQAYTPRFSPDGASVVYSAWSKGGFRDLRLVNVKDGSFVDLTRDRSLDVQPCWSADGKTIYFASDRTGIFNIYAMDVATRSTKMVTNVVNAALGPAVSEDGKTLVYVGYTHSGYDLFSMPLDESQFLDAPPGEIERPRPYAEPAPVTATKQRYNPLATLRPRSYFLDVGPGNYGSTAVTFSASGSDLVGRHSLSAAVRFDPGAPEPRMSLAYTYGGLPVDVGLRLTRATVPRASGFSLGAGELPYNETSSNASTSVSLPIRNPFASQFVALSYTAALYHQNLTTTTTLDPFGPRPQKPEGGFLSQIGVSYSLSTSQFSENTAGGGRTGFDFNVGLSLADENTGSSSSLYEFDAAMSGYIPMPWPGYHTLALRASAGVSAGDYPRRGRYFVGGYDLVNNGPLDTLVSGIYDGAFVLRGYDAGAANGTAYFLSTAEYRAPIFTPNWGPSTLPLFLRQVDASVFADWGGAFDKFDFEAVRFFHNSHPIDAKELKTSVGAEVWLAMVLAYRIPTNLRVGYAYGFDPGAVPSGQLYFLSTSAF